MKVYLKDNVRDMRNCRSRSTRLRQEAVGRSRQPAARRHRADLQRRIFGRLFRALRAVRAKDLPHRQLVLQAEDIRERLLRTAGVLKVNILGEQQQQIFVDDLLQAAGDARHHWAAISSMRLASQNDVTPAGFVDTKGPRIYLQPRWRDRQPSTSSRTSRSSPMAEPSRSATSPRCAAAMPIRRASLIRNRGVSRALVLGVVMKPGFTGLVPRQSRSRPQDAKACKRSFRSGSRSPRSSTSRNVIAEAIREFMTKFFTALAVVIVVSLLSLGWRVRHRRRLGDPADALRGLRHHDADRARDFDRITLGALIISLGLLVDDAIIAIEMMVVKMEEGLDRIAAATFAWHSDRGADADRHARHPSPALCRWASRRRRPANMPGNIFWVVGFSLITSWFVAVFFISLSRRQAAARHQEGEPVATRRCYGTRMYQRLRSVVRSLRRS